MIPSLYEHPAWQSTPQKVMRPGGLEITTRALACCPLPAGARLLDVGCGAGAALHSIGAARGWRCFGVDCSAKLLRAAHSHNAAARFAQSAGEHLPFATGSLDAILAECTLSIMESGQALRECARALKPGGYLIVNDIYARNPAGVAALRSLPPGSCIRAALPREQILDMLQQHALELICWQDCSEVLKDFDVCALATTADLDPFDLYLAAARARLGYYSLVAQMRSLSAR